MTTILAIDTATDACSVALYRDGEYTELYEVVPRAHSIRLLPMLQELLPGPDLRAAGIDAIAYSNGPGSFTGLRISASAVQGLAFANELPAIGVSTLACQVQTAVRAGLLGSGEWVLSMLDARINEVYWSLIETTDAAVREQSDPVVCPPAEVLFGEGSEARFGVGGGFLYLNDLPRKIANKLESVWADVLPSARDLIPLALEKFSRGEVQRANEILPVYVREEISWKKLSEQGKTK